MKGNWGKWLLTMAFLLLSVISLTMVIKERSLASVLDEKTCESSAFRDQHLETEFYEEIRKKAKNEADFGNLLTAAMLNGKFYPERVSFDSRPYVKYKNEEFICLRSLYETIWTDVSCFPIPGRNISYEDSFGAPRSFGGERKHEGTDLFGKLDVSGYYPVLSMTDGVVEKTGWLPLGGYRIGIRAPHGGYFYYAHLSGYEKEFQTGEHVEAGEILGYMGNTGYGPKGTAGQFPVHLHLGIYISTPEKEELSVNPYWVLRAVQKNMRKYTY